MCEEQRLLAMALFRYDFPDGPLPLDPPEPAMKWANKFMSALQAVGATVVPLPLAESSSIEVNSPFDRVPVCACDPGTGPAPTKQQQLECRLRGGHCAE